MEKLDQQDTRLRQILSAGAQPGSRLQDLLGVSSATLSRIIQRNRDGVLTVGAARASEYALFHPLTGLGASFPVYSVDERGDVSQLGSLYLLAANQYGWQEGKKKPVLLDHVPFLIQNMRPEGFMGRALAHELAQELGLPPKLQDWTDRQVITALAQRGEDFVGNLILGQESMQRYLRLANAENLNAVRNEDRAGVFERIALQAISGELPGTSAGGEQPKFTALVEDQRVIVKFANRRSTEGQRWSDLLVCEHLAARILADHGVMAARTEIVQTDEWTYLQSSRFDRLGLWGRRSLVSLGAVIAEYVGTSQNWVEAAGQLESDRLISEQAADLLRLLAGFGALIGNTDMHLGNVSLFPEARGFTLAPVYDMTPMHYRPRPGGVLNSGTIDLQTDEILFGRHPIRDWAIEFWNRARSDSRISDDFRSFSDGNIEKIKLLESRPKIRLLD